MPEDSPQSSERHGDINDQDDQNKALMERTIASQRAYHRKKRIERFGEYNPLAWFFNEFPAQDMYRSFAFRRNTRQEMRHHWLRQRTSWTFLSKLKTVTGVRYAAAAGLISAIFQAAPSLMGKNPTPASPFIWLLGAGLIYLLSVLSYEIFCPLLLKQMLGPRSASLGIHGRRWLRALVEDELRRWWSKREWQPAPELLDLTKMEDQNVLGIMSGYGTPAYAGFGPYARAHIELALDDFAKSQKIKLWTYRDKFEKQLEAFEPGYGYEANRPWMEQLRVRRPTQALVEENHEVASGDFIITWHYSPVGISHHLPDRKSILIEREAEGLVYLFDNDEQAASFSENIAAWQDSMHPWRRLLILFLYAASSLTFVVFVIQQLCSTLLG